MDTNSGRWQEEGTEDIQCSPNPLLELFAELAICYDAVARHDGTFCTSCSCSLGYHVPCDNGDCEFCGCADVYKYCASCGQTRALAEFQVGKNGVSVCQYCVNFSPVRIKPINRPVGRGVPGVIPYYPAGVVSDWERNRTAREVLKELSE